MIFSNRSGATARGRSRLGKLGPLAVRTKKGVVTQPVGAADVSRIAIHQRVFADNRLRNVSWLMTFSVSLSFRVSHGKVKTMTVDEWVVGSNPNRGGGCLQKLSGKQFCTSQISRAEQAQTGSRTLPGIPALRSHLCRLEDPAQRLSQMCPTA